MADVPEIPIVVRDYGDHYDDWGARFIARRAAMYVENGANNGDVCSLPSSLTRLNYVNLQRFRYRTGELGGAE